MLDASSFSIDFSVGSFSLTNDGNSLLIRYTPALVPLTWGSYGPWSGVVFSRWCSAGPAGQPYEILISTDVSLPMASWMPLTSGMFGAGPVYLPTLRRQTVSVFIKSSHRRWFITRAISVGISV